MWSALLALLASLGPYGALRLHVSRLAQEAEFDALEAGGSRVTFIIGGADGLPPALKADPGRLLSLSRLTFTHQMARLLLIEQIYRATEIRRGSGYHKD